MALYHDSTSVVLDVEESKDHETICWGCKLRLNVPHYATAFKCGWCGALTFANSQLRKHRRWLCCAIFRDRLLVGVVLAIIFCITGGGLMAVYPILFPKHGITAFINIIITAILALNTLYNYCLSSFFSPGAAAKVPWGSPELATKGALEGFMFCVYCERPKPPQAHHCRTCGICVMDMDHHCPFIGNCVGASNHRHFVLFLFYTLVSVCYVLLMSTIAGLNVWPHLLELYDPASSRPKGAFRAFGTIVGASFMDAFTEDIATKSLSLIYLIIVSFTTALGLGLLLRQQLHLLYEGQTYLDSLQHVSEHHTPGWHNLRKLFGSRHPFFWLFPTLPGSKSRDKLQ